jgi:membrane fusion protein, heavy metal efflux system
MESKKLNFLFVGIVIGAMLLFFGTYIYNNILGEDVQNISESEQHQDNDLNDDHKGEEPSEDEDIVNLSDAEIKELGIVIKKVETKKLMHFDNFTGEIVPNPEKLVHIVPRFAGVVREVYIEMGDRVKKGDLIAIIESNESLVTYEVKSSIDGVVLELHMTPGEMIGDHSHAVTIADLRSVWVELNVYQKDLMNIKINQKAKIYLDKIENGIESKIFYISPIVNKETRTAIARAKLNNNSGYWKPGMFISAKVLTENNEVKHAVELDAIQNFEGRKVVFVKEGNSFRPKPVTIGMRNGKYAQILTGLKADDNYISEGAFVIKSELLKESFGGGHNH